MKTKLVVLIAILILLTACKYEPPTQKKYYSENPFDWQPSGGASTLTNRSSELFTEGQYSIQLYANDRMDGKWDGWASWTKNLQENLTNVSCVLLDAYSERKVAMMMLFYDNSSSYGRSTSKAPSQNLSEGWNKDLLFYVPDYKDNYARLGEITKIGIIVGSTPFNRTNTYVDNFRTISDEISCFMLEKNKSTEVNYTIIREVFE